ncbi:hypothetical protein BKA63DRAFT_594514, partial [Paraphoma chrysanthemicola]
PKVPRRHADLYIAPSWSWASLDGKISFEWCQRDFDKAEYLASIESVAVVQRDESRFGRVLSGQLVMRAPIALCRWKSEDRKPTLRPWRAAIVDILALGASPDQTSRTIPLNVYHQDKIGFDTAEDRISKNMIVLPIIGTMRKTAHESEAVFALILSRSEENYRRIGFLYTKRTQVCRILRNMQRQTFHHTLMKIMVDRVFLYIGQLFS